MLEIIFWMIILIGFNLIGFVYFANIAMKSERLKSNKI